MKKKINTSKKNITSSFSLKKTLSALALIGVLFLPLSKAKAQESEKIKDIYKKNLIEVIDQKQRLDVELFDVVLERFEYNTFIHIKTIPRNEYELLNNIYIKNNDGVDVLCLPEDLKINEIELIIQELNKNTFGMNDQPNHSAFSKIKKISDKNSDEYYKLLLESIFEYGLDSLSNINNFKTDFIKNNISLEEELNKAKAEGNIKKISKIQKKIAENIVSYVHNFGWNNPKNNPFDLISRNEKGKPTSSINDKISNCITKSSIIYKLLEYYEISNWGCYSVGHQAIKIVLDNGVAYYVDAEKFATIIPWKEDKKLNTKNYYNIHTPKGKINTIVEDTEYMIIANMLYNNAVVFYEKAKIEKDTLIKKELFEKSYIYLESAFIFHESIPLFWTLGAEIFYNKGNLLKDEGEREKSYKKSLEYLEKAIVLDEKNPKNRELKGEILRKQGNKTESDEAYKKFKKITLDNVNTK